MKKTILYSGILLLLTGCVQAPDSGYVAPIREPVVGLLVDYKFNEETGSKATNSARDRWHGALNGVGRIASPNGRAIHFDGSGSRVAIDTIQYHVSPDMLQFKATGQITIEAFVRIAGMLPDQLFQIAGAGQSSGLWLRGGRPEFTVAGLSGSDSVVLTSDTILAANTWYHIVLSYNGSDAIIYINGQENKRANKSYALTDMYVPFLGGSAFVSADFVGDMDEVRIHNIALTAQQVMDRYNSLAH